MPTNRHHRLLLLLLAAVTLAGTGNANERPRWRTHPDVGLLTNVVLRIYWFDSSEALREASEASGQQINETGLKGFSLLKRNSKTGEYVCELYVLKMTGAQLDGDRTTTFGHEVLHCFGLRHE